MKRIGLLYLHVLLFGLLSVAPVRADQVFTEPLIVIGSGCIGSDCLDGENLDDTTLRLKENNLRIMFDDTTAGAADWWLTANDSINGGQSFFAFSDQEIVTETITTLLTLNEYASQLPDGQSYVPALGIYIFVDSGVITSCLGGCPDGETTIIPVTTYSSNANEQDVWIDPSDNTFQINDSAVVVGTEAAPRRLVNVADGIATSDVATVGQLTVAQDTLAAVIALGDDAVAGADTLATRLDEVESTIAPQAARLDTVESQLTTLTTGVETAESSVANQQILVDQAETDVTALHTAVDQITVDAAANSAAQQLLAPEIETVAAQATSNSEQLVTIASTIGSFATTGGDEGEMGSSTQGEGSTALGEGASARTRDTAIGYQATVTADGSVAIGAETLVESANSVAVGADSQVASNAEGAVALGQAAQVVSGATGAVALGQQSVANEAQTVSVGSSTNQRRITQVAAAQNDHDAINFTQLMEMSNQFQATLTGLARQIGDVDDRLDDSGAMMMALSALIPNIRSHGATQASFGLGHYSGANAIAGGVFHYLSDTVLLSAGISSAFNTNSTAIQTGLVVSW